jgi:hypothetical protein
VEEVDPEEQERRRKRAERFGIPGVVRFRVELSGDSQVLTQTFHRVRRLDILCLRSDHNYSCLFAFEDIMCCNDWRA